MNFPGPNVAITQPVMGKAPAARGDRLARAFLLLASHPQWRTALVSERRRELALWIGFAMGAGIFAAVLNR